MVQLGLWNGFILFQPRNQHWGEITSSSQGCSFGNWAACCNFAVLAGLWVQLGFPTVPMFFLMLGQGLVAR